MRYISDDVKKGFEAYKYSSRDTSPLANYVMHPFWNWLVQFLPRWLAPNLMTLIGFLLLVFNFLALAYYDPDFTASSKEYSNSPPIPSWFWLVCAIFNFLSHTLDGCDGKQARRTGTSSPIGEMFDHGCDSWATLFFPVCLYSVFGRGAFGGSPVTVLAMMMVVKGSFILSHFEKYNTGILYLPWGYDVSQNGMTLTYLVTWMWSADTWQNYAVEGGVTYAHLVIYAVQISFWFMSLPVTLWNIYWSYADKTGRLLSARECLRPLVSTILLFACSLVWAYYSPTGIINSHPRLFYVAMGTAFSNIASRMIVAQMSKTQADLLNPLGTLYCLVALTATLLPRHWIIPHELSMLWALSGLVVVLHVVYAFIVVNEMLDHFGLRAFIIAPKRTSSSSTKYEKETKSD